MIQRITVDRILTAALVITATVLAGMVTMRFTVAKPPAQPDPSEALRYLIGRDAPVFQMETIDKDTVTLPDKGVESLIIALRSDCILCQASLPLWRQLSSKRCDLQITLASAEPVETLQNFWNLYGWASDPSCAEPKIGRVIDTSAFQKSYGVGGTPAHYVIDSRGVISDVIVGAFQRSHYDLITADSEE